MHSDGPVIVQSPLKHEQSPPNPETVNVYCEGKTAQSHSRPSLLSDDVSDEVSEDSSEDVEEDSSDELEDNSELLLLSELLSEEDTLDEDDDEDEKTTGPEQQLSNSHSSPAPLQSFTTVPGSTS